MYKFLLTVCLLLIGYILLIQAGEGIVGCILLGCLYIKCAFYWDVCPGLCVTSSMQQLHLFINDHTGHQPDGMSLEDDES